jgi:hypothetical protein
MKHLFDALRELDERFRRLKIEYALIGGMAVRTHGISRPTHDLDMLVALRPGELTPLFDAVEAVGFTVDDHYRSGWVDRVADMPLVKVRRYLGAQSLDVDIFLSECAFQESALRRAQLADVDGFKGRVISPEDLILFKLQTPRHRDLGDIIDVLFMQGQLDEAYLRHWAERLGVLDKLEQALKESREL